MAGQGDDPPLPRATESCGRPAQRPTPTAPAGSRPSPPRLAPRGSAERGRRGSASACPGTGPPFASS
eukprot:2877979-Pleurochrysis_carterae.AAC.2